MTASGNTGSGMVPRMFLPAALSMIVTQMVGVAANIIDGMITSRVLGDVQYSSVALLWPFICMVIMLANFLAIGNQVVCSRLVGRGEKERANRAFATAFTAELLTGVLLAAACILIPSVLLQVCGVSVDNHPEYYGHMTEYLRGYMPGIPAMLLIQLFGPVIVLDNNRNLFVVSAGVLCAVDAGGDLLNAFVFHGGLFGMGLATTVSFYAQLLLLMTHFLRKNSYFHLSFRKASRRDLPEIARAGIPALIQRLATVLRDLFVSRLNLSIALSAAAVSAKGIQGDLNTLMFCLGIGVGRVMMTMTGISFGAADRVSLRRLFGSMVKVSLGISLGVGAALFLAAPVIAGIYTSDPEVVSLVVFGIRCMAAGLALDTLAAAYQDYLQGIRRRKLLNVLIFCERFFIPTAMAAILGLGFGSKGILASLAAGKAVLVLVVFAAVWVVRERVPRSVEDYMLLPEEFGGGEGENLYAEIRTSEDAIRVSRQAENFCLACGADSRAAKIIALCTEEMAVNVVEHGKPRQGRPSVDYRLYKEAGGLCISLRDYCRYFDPTAWYELHRRDAGASASGIRLVTEMATEVRYFNAFNSNNILIRLRTGAEDPGQKAAVLPPASGTGRRSS